MKIENCKLKISQKAFTLIEIMVAIAIVGILAAAVLVSMKSYGAKARASKALAQLSSVIPSMISCWGNGNGVVTFVNQPDVNGGEPVCTLSDSYGMWPSMTGDLGSYKYASGWTGSNDWAFYAKSDDDGRLICCNSAMKGCKMQYDGEYGCSATEPKN
jgi:prepilin-type N-terminal cleavage/methylation domain-containing protein